MVLPPELRPLRPQVEVRGLLWGHQCAALLLLLLLAHPTWSAAAGLMGSCVGLGVPGECP